MFGLGSPFKRNSHYVYNYTPRHYDERKERLEKLKEKYENLNSEEQDDEDITIAFTKNNLKNAWKKTRKSDDGNKSARRIALIIAILVGIVAYIFELHKLI